MVVCVNKLDTPGAGDVLMADFYELGLETVVGVSAEHNIGMGELLDAVLVHFGPPEPKPEPMTEEEAAVAPVRVAIIGRPNTGKSTLVNALLKQKRIVMSPIAGTTRDPIDAEVQFNDQRFLLTDTAGIRRKKSIAQRVEHFSVVAALRVLERSDVAVLLMDATEPAVDQDAKLAGLASEMGRALLIVVNKWDLVEKNPHEEEDWREALKREFKFVAYSPIMFTSALNGRKIEKVLELAAMLHKQFHYRASTPMLNRLLEHMVDSNPAPIARGKPLRLYYMAQVSVAPPAFAITCNAPKEVPDSYKRYITNRIRETFGLRVPITLYFRDRPGQAKRAARKRPTKDRH